MYLNFTPKNIILVLALTSSPNSSSFASTTTITKGRGARAIISTSDRFSSYHYLHRDDNGNDSEKTAITRRHPARKITASIFKHHGVTSSGRNFDYPDVGILQGKTSHRSLHRQFGRGAQRGLNDDDDAGVDDDITLPRSLQAETAFPLCGINGTCAPNMCNALSSLLTAYTAPVEFNAICNGYTDASSGKNWTFEGCVNDYYKDIPGQLDYVKSMYCQIAKCSIEGGTYGACYCQLYHDACLKNGNERPFDVSKNVKKSTHAILLPLSCFFFVCVSSQSYSQPGFCEMDACCQNKTDEAGMLSCLEGSYPSRNKYRQDNPRCRTNGTCYPSFCNSYVGALQAFDFAVPLNAICNGVTDANGKKWGIEGCIRDYPGYPDYQLYYTTMNCELAKCFVDGGTEVSCYCQMFHTMCDMFGDAGKYNVSQNKAKHFRILLIQIKRTIYLLCY
jgi:hypothetical protein